MTPAVVCFGRHRLDTAQPQVEMAMAVVTLMSDTYQVTMHGAWMEYVLIQTQRIRGCMRLGMVAALSELRFTHNVILLIAIARLQNITCYVFNYLTPSSKVEAVHMSYVYGPSRDNSLYMQLLGNLWIWTQCLRMRSR